MTKAEDMRARAARIAQRSSQGAADAPAEVSEPAPVEPTVTRPVVRSTPVRITADLPPQSYRSLVDYAASLAARFGRARVPHVNVIRALVLELERDETLQERIASRIAEQLED
jgi:hypothetical protein